MFWILYTVATALGVIALDQISKLLIVKYLYEAQIVIIPGVLNFTYVENRGMAFGLLADHRAVFILLAMVGLCAVGFYLWRFGKTVLCRISLAMIVGGGIGNMIDRLGRGFVVDFLDFCAFPSLWYWVFNVADAAICVGAGLFILDMILDIIKEAKLAKKTPVPPTKKEDQDGDAL